MKTRLEFDCRRDEMDSFLKQLYEMHKDVNIGRNVVYNMMKNYGLKSEDTSQFGYKGDNIEPLFNDWFERFKTKKNTLAYRDMVHFLYFFQFVSRTDVPCDKFIKFYIPLDKEHLEDGVNLLFDYIDKENIKHQSKVGKEMRSDNVIVRVDKNDIEAQKKILNFLTKNRYIRKGLNKTNPFVPSVNGIGMMSEHGNSYNGDLAYYIEHYIREAKKNNLETVSIEGFRDFLIYCQQNNIRYDYEKYFDYELFVAFETAYFGKRVAYTKDQKRAMFMDAITNMYNHYGMNHTIEAIKDIVFRNSYHIIPNIDSKVDLKGNLEYFVSREDVLDFINVYASALNMDNKNDVETSISIFCQNLFQNKEAIKFDEICNATLSKYGTDQLKTALRYYVLNANIDRFTRSYKDSKVNYRQELSTFDQRFCLDTITHSLNNKGVFLENPTLDDYIDNYVDSLTRSQYTDLTSRPSSIKV